MEDLKNDKRFSHVFTDPQYRRIPKNVRKVKVDNRFKDMLKNKKFSEKCRVNERGRALKLDSFENFSKLYNLDESSESDVGSDENNDAIVEKKKSTKTEMNSQKKSVTKDLLSKNKISREISEELSKTSFAECDDLKKKKSMDNIKLKPSKVKKNEKSNKTDLRFKETDVSDEENSEDESEEIKKESDKMSPLSKSKDLKKQKKLNKKDSRDDVKLKSLKSNNKNQGKLENKTQVSDLRFKENFESAGESSEDESDEDYEKTNCEIYSEEDSDTNSEEESEEDSDSEENDSDGKESDEFDHQWEEQHERAPDTDEVTRRLAVCNMDWDRIRAVDLFVVFNSFKPPDTTIISVKIYPSEYGLQRMEEEKLKGPPELVEKTLAPDEEEVEDKKGGRYHREKLRQYQMNRLKYYYAILECDTPETANTLYEQLNGMEYESSSVRFDLRFVPDDTTFDHEPTSVADNPDLGEYKPKLFVTSALQQVKVGLTWDETDPQRREVLQKAFTEPDDIEKDIKEYLASSSGESEDELEENEENTKLSFKERIQKYKALLGSLDEQDKEKNDDKYDMEITWQQ